MSRFVHWMIVRLDPHEAYASHYWAGQGWTASARRHRQKGTDGFTLPPVRPILFTSLKEARTYVRGNIPPPLPPRTRVWAENSRARQTMFHP